MSGRGSRRRQLMVLGGLVLAAAALPQLGSLRQRLLPPELDLAPLADPPGFRRLAGGPTSGGFDPLVGLPVARPRATEAAAVDDLCRALFGAPVPPGVVPIASFSDFLCPYCRLLTPRLARLEADGGVRVAWHEWPILGEASLTAARAALAAERQGAYVAFQAALTETAFVPTPALLDEIAARLGLDDTQLRTDAAGPEVARALATSRSLAERLRFPGTPALVVGRTVVLGAIDDRQLRALVDRERADGPVPGCA